MELRTGCKQTELGVIPKDWCIRSLSDISRKITDGEHITPKRAKQGYYLLSARNVLNGRLDVQDVDYVGAEEFFRIRQRCNPEPGDVLISCSGTIGRVAVVPQGFECVLVRSAALAKIDSTKADCFFIQYWLQSKKAQGQISNSVNQGAQPNLFLNHIERLNCLLPPLPEQHAIATTLSDVDALLASQDKLIAKKRDIKQAAMQQLLTGKQRLPGFSGEWEVKRLGDILKEISDGATPSTANRDNFDGSISWVVIDDIKDEIWTTKNTLTEKGLRSCAATLWQPGTLILSTGATIGEVGIALVPVATKQGICGLVFDAQNAHTKFMKYWFVLNKPMLLSMAQGSSIKEVRAPTLIQFEVHLPSLDEQSAIATVLSDMDDALTALEQQRNKTRALKQGMMQELLTGRIRLI